MENVRVTITEIENGYTIEKMWDEPGESKGPTEMGRKEFFVKELPAEIAQYFGDGEPDEAEKDAEEFEKEFGK